jgi:hypothetical protein
MTDFDQPLALTNPEANRSLTLSTHYLMKQDFVRALHHSRVAVVARDPAGAMNLLTTLVLTRKFEAAAEVAATMLEGPLHHTTRKGLLDVVIPALYFMGGREGDCSLGYRAAYELAAHGELNPERVKWRGQSLQGKSLLVTLSQAGLGGMGDHIMWARFIPYVVAQGARILVQCPPLLKRLFMTIPGVLGTCDYEERPPCDYAANIMELPWVLGMTGIPVANPFNVRAVPMPQETHNVGINWGASWATPYMDRACALSEYLPLTRIPGVRLFGLQKGAHQKQLYPPPVGIEVHDLAPQLTDFLDTAVLLNSMDAVVTTDNVVGNLSCMLGRPTFVLVPKCADWRWGEDGRAPWYPSARVHQQDVIGEWGAPIARLVADLGACLDRTGKLSIRTARPEPTASDPAATEGAQQPNAQEESK